MNFLDKTGLTELWNKIKDKFASKEDVTEISEKTNTIEATLNSITENQNETIMDLTIESGTTISNNYILAWTDYSYYEGQLEVYWNGCKLIEKTSKNNDGHYTTNPGTAIIYFYRTDNDGDYTLTKDAHIQIIIKHYIIP